MKAIFSLFDVHGTGRINAETIRKVLSNTGEHLDEAELEDMVQEADTNNDGVITEEDFMRMLKRTVGTFSICFVMT